jgi:ribonuclease E
MSQRMLIDARHREETRMAVLKGNRIEEFDFESIEHAQIKGNIYLAKVTRVEPSLQAAFVEYGGNKQGFLAFSEIHPDYYQIPKEDREALLREEAEAAAEEARLRDDDHDDEDMDAQEQESAYDDAENAGDDENAAPAPDTQSEESTVDASESLRVRRRSIRRRYKIQDVIHRRQVLLVQVVKEERGNKGAAMTTYLSLAGRYCVLMPNTTHGGGVSRKISNVGDRKRLKSIMNDLNLPASMGCIVRTAGLQRTKTEIKRDFDYLARLWDEIREKTLASQAPSQIYTDSDIIRRAVRDIYHRDIDEVLVEGELGYKQAREYMRQLMPSHVKKVKPYQDTVSLFQRYGAEDQLGAMYQPVVQLKSGGYLVINPTEALVSIDINSGRSTKEHGIEQTALNTNLEAAHEIARQLRLRDMAGLVVIDFIDMEHHSNIRKVEKAMKMSLANDRARIQVGRISAFGLLEMSRQRLRTGVLEASTRRCPHCEGSGLVRTASSAGLSALRLLEEEAGLGRGSHLVLRASQEATLYLLNNKRTELAQIESRYGVRIEVLPDSETEGAKMNVEVSGPPPLIRPVMPPLIIEEEEEEYIEEADEEIEELEEQEESSELDSNRRKRKRSRKRRSGGRGGRDYDAPQTEEPQPEMGSDGSDSEEAEAESAGDEELSGWEQRAAKTKRRRGSRGGANQRGARARGYGSTQPQVNDDAGAPESDETVALHNAHEIAPEAEAIVEATMEAAPVSLPEMAEDEPVKKRATRTRKPKAETESAEVSDVAPSDTAQESVAAEKPKRGRKPKAKAPVAEVMVADSGEAAPTGEVAPTGEGIPSGTSETSEPKVSLSAETGESISEEAPAPSPTAEPVAEAAATPSGTRKRGWWQRTFGEDDSAGESDKA